MGSVCGSTLSLMAPAYPSKAGIGVAMGLIKDGDNFPSLTEFEGRRCSRRHGF